MKMRLRVRNPRGQGARLREELIATATAMVERGDLDQLTLRGIARAAGIAPTSVYAHFPDVDHLLGEVVQRGFDGLASATSAAAVGTPSPETELRARCLAYCRFGLDHANLYRLMFEARIPASVSADPETTPGRRSFERLVAAVRACMPAADAQAAFRLAALIWAADHGLVLARHARPTFPWPPLEAMVDDLISGALTNGSR